MKCILNFTDDGHVDTKAKDAKKCVTKREIEFQNHKDCPENKKMIFKFQQRFRGITHYIHQKYKQYCSMY